MLVDLFERANELGQLEIVVFYLGHVFLITNWDLVDSYSHKIVGAYLLGRGLKFII